MNPYGDEVTIIKHECVGHVKKRVVKRFNKTKVLVNGRKRPVRVKIKSLVDKENELKKKVAIVRKRRVKGSGQRAAKEKGRSKAELDHQSIRLEIEELRAFIQGVLNESNITKIADYYAMAIRNHTNDLDGMTKACWAVFYHSTSTHDNPQHQFCPSGADS